jgi:hypothetical protein
MDSPPVAIELAPLYSMDRAGLGAADTMIRSFRDLIIFRCIIIQMLTVHGGR